MLKKTDLNVLEKIVKLFGAYEHDSKFKISGKEVDSLVQDSEKYLKMLKDLREQIEKRASEKTIEQVYEDVFKLLKTILKTKTQTAMIEEFERDFIKKGKFAPQNLKILKNIVGARKDFKKGKLNAHKVDEARKNAMILINDLVEYNQRCDLMNNKKKE